MKATKPDTLCKGLEQSAHSMIAASAGDAAALSISFSSPTADDLDDSQQCRLYGSTALSILFTLPIRRKSARAQHASTGAMRRRAAQPQLGCATNNPNATLIEMFCFSLKAAWA